jgi:antitoxin (DNA-binding transcriptional repressor) of toxin-antitoxin stability system
MSTITVDIHNSQINWQDLISEMRAGNEVLIVDGEKPVARVTPVEDQERIPGLFPNSVQMSDDFDDPLSEEFILGEE